MIIPLIIIGAGLATIYSVWRASQTAPQQTGAPQSVPSQNGTPNYSGFFTGSSAPSMGVSAPGNGPAVAGVGLSAASSGLSIASQVAQNGQGGGGGDGGGLSTGQELGIAGAVLGVAAGIYGMIAAHHAAAVKAEASHLNDAVPHFHQGLGLITQGVASKQLTIAQATALLDQLMGDYYTMVLPSLEMNNKEKGIPAMRAADIKLVLIDPKTPGPVGGYMNSVKLSHCNGPCIVAVVYLENRLQRVKDALPVMASGQHGALNFVTIAPHAGFGGYPAYTLSW